MTSENGSAGGATETVRSDSRRKVLQGRVVSVKMQKTVVVAVDRIVRHRIYKKAMTRTNRYKAHDEENSCVLGDIVRIVETRPLSKEKRWRVAEILTRGNVAEVQPNQIGAEVEGRAPADDDDEAADEE